MHGKSVRIFLPDGVVGGLRHAEIVNWTGQAVACPRARFSELQHWLESDRPGVYFLLVGPTGSERGSAYIGESDNVLVRARAHLNLDFWNEIVVFSSKDENLTKAHVKFLESKLIAQATAARRFALHNTGGSVATSLPRADLAAMAEFLEALRLILGTLGYPLLEPLDVSSQGDSASPVFRMTGKTFDAYGRIVDEGFLLLEGSKIPPTPPSLSTPGIIQELWKATQKSGDFLAVGEFLATTKPMLFSSPSYAAAFVSGAARNGRKEWRTPDGQTLAEIEERAGSVDPCPAQLTLTPTPPLSS